MDWDEILKNQITSTKQGVLSSDGPLPKKKKKKDCNQILIEMADSLNELFDIEIKQIMKRNKDKVVKYITDNRLPMADGGLLPEIRISPDIDSGDKSSSRKKTNLSLIAGKTLTVALGVVFKPLDDEDDACKILFELRDIIPNAIYSNNRGNILRTVDTEIDGAILDFIISLTTNNGQGMMIYGYLGQFLDGGGFNNIFRPDFERILKNVLSIINAEY